MKGNLVSACAVTYNFLVSIHALTWRATDAAGYQTDKKAVSIHALTWRATNEADKVFREVQGFNPRPHMEGDNLRR